MQGISRWASDKVTEKSSFSLADFMNTYRVFKVGLNCVATSDDGTSTTGTNTSTNSVVAEVPCQMNYYVPTKEDTDQTMSEYHSNHNHLLKQSMSILYLVEFS